jgi:uncharacterized cupredoxin-like copper-binding protein
MNPIHATLVLSLAAAPGFALAHSEGDHAKRPTVNKLSTEEHPFGRQGDPKMARRTINVDMSDAMRFTPGEIVVKRGETVRFVVRNGGRIMHEMVIGTEDELRKHADMMKKHPGMEHDEPYMAHVKPGSTERITWTFSKPGTFMYGCLIPGHFEAGMKGTIKVVAK